MARRPSYYIYNYYFYTYTIRLFSNTQEQTWLCTNQLTSRQRPGAEVQETPTTVTQQRCTMAEGVQKRSRNRHRGGRSTCCNRTRSGRYPSRPEDVAVSPNYIRYIILITHRAK